MDGEMEALGLPGSTVVENPPANAGDAGDTVSIPGSRRFPWRRVWLPTPVFLPGESPWTEEPGRLQPMGSQRVGHDWATEHTDHVQNWGSPCSSSLRLPAFLGHCVLCSQPPEPGQFHQESLSPNWGQSQAKIRGTHHSPYWAFTIHSFIQTSQISWVLTWYCSKLGTKWTQFLALIRFIL